MLKKELYTDNTSPMGIPTWSDLVIVQSKEATQILLWMSDVWLPWMNPKVWSDLRRIRPGIFFMARWSLICCY